MSTFGIGQSVRRLEDARFLCGAGCYVDDIELPEQAIGYFVRSMHAHAELGAIDATAARCLPGVIGIITGADLEVADIGPMPCTVTLENRDGTPLWVPVRPILASRRVRHVGDPIALIVAQSIHQARDAAELLSVEYRNLAAVADITSALAEGGPLLWEEAPGNLAFDWQFGDRRSTDKLFECAARVVAVDLVNNRVVPSPVETRACIGRYIASDGSFELHVSSQGSHNIQEVIAEKIFGLPKDKLRVITPDVGGAFGAKLFAYPEYVAILFATRKFGRPIKWVCERSEAFVSDIHGRDHVTHAELALDGDGQFLALRARVAANMGAYLSDHGPRVATLTACRMIVGPYLLKDVYCEVRGVYTNTPPLDAYRGAGRAEATYLVERLVDAAARETGLGPIEIRRRNFIPASAMPYRCPTGEVYDSGDFEGNLDKVGALSNWQDFGSRRTAARRRGALRGIGLAAYIEWTGAGAETAQIVIDADGKAIVSIGTQSSGQGHETTFAQLVHDGLGIAVPDVCLLQGDTGRIATGGGSSGSRSIPVGSACISEAVGKIVAKARDEAADMLEAAAADLAYDRGVFRVIGTDRQITISEIARAARRPIAFAEIGRHEPVPSFANGVHVCEVEIDGDTGAVHVEAYAAVDDFGTIVNPLLAEGQVHGGVAQGIGQALCERTVFDFDSGQLLTGSFMDYALPRADDIPLLTVQFNEIPAKTNPLGAKGAGEAGATVAPAAVVAAMADALAEFDGASVEMPVTAEQIWQLLRTSMGRTAPSPASGLDIPSGTRRQPEHAPG